MFIHFKDFVLTVLQACVWNTWGPITESAKAVFGWQDSDIGMFANYGNISFMIFVLPLCYFVDVKGKQKNMFFKHQFFI